MFKKLFVLLFFSIIPFSGLSNAGQIHLIPRDLLDTVGLDLQWQVNVPVKAHESVDRMFVFDSYLYVLTDSNYLICVDRNKGKVRFGLQLAMSGLPISEAQFYDDRLYFMVGNELIVINPVSGQIESKKKFRSIGKSTVCALGRNQDFLYVAGAERKLHVIALDGYWQKYHLTADDDSIINSVYVEPDVVFFTTETGSVVCVDAFKPKKKWQYNIIGKIKAPLAKEDQWLYVTSLNTKLYKLNSENGKPGWVTPFQAGSQLTTKPRIAESAVYVYAGLNGIYAVNKQTGDAIWNLPEGIGFVAEQDSKAYVFAKPSVLVVMDNQTGEHVYSINFTNVTDYALNNVDSIIYVSDETGRVAAIKQK